MKLQLGVVSILSLLPFWPGVLGGQIPRVNGVIGGVRCESLTTETTSQQRILKSVQRTPGKLRGVVENSGICGSLVFFSFAIPRV